MSNDWIKHNGGPQPVGDETWVRVDYDVNQNWRSATTISANAVLWPSVTRYRILNQHLIDAARLEGIRLGLECAMAALLKRPNGYRWADDLLALNPESIAREAVLIQLTREAQAQGMGYATEAGQ